MAPTVKPVAVDDTSSSLEFVAESLQQEGLAVYMMTMSDTLDVEDLPESIRRPDNWKPEAAAAGLAPDASSSLEDHERELLTGALQRAGGNQSEAARILSISRDRMRYKMGKYNLR